MSLFLKTILYGALFGAFLNISDATETDSPKESSLSQKGTNYLPNSIKKSLEEGDNDENIFQREKRNCTKRCIDAKQPECPKKCEACINKCIPAHLAGVSMSQAEKAIAALTKKKGVDTRGKFFFVDCTAKCPKD